MKWNDLGNPCPRTKPHLYQPVIWPNDGEVPLGLPTINIKDKLKFFELVNQRRTQRKFLPINFQQLGNLLWMTNRVQRIGSEELGFPLSQRPCPSAGAIHSIHVLLIQPEKERWYRYDPFAHVLQVIPSQINAGSVINALQEVLTAPNATLLLLAAEPGMTAAKYEAADSLVWRDAGVVLGFLSMASQALGLSFCPLGVTGEPWVSQLVEQPGLVGVGAAFVGSFCPN